MSKINITNYEAFMLDYLEGNLSPQDTLALKAFAILHPELDLNFDDELVTLKNENFSFAAKQNLKVGFNDEFVIGYLENVLTAEEKQVADKLALNNFVFKKELDRYKKTVLVPDAEIVFENKALLKHEPKTIVFTQSISLRIAAAILLMIGIWLVTSKVAVNDSGSIPQIASKTKKENNTPTITPPQEKLKQPEISSEKIIANVSSQKRKRAKNNSITKEETNNALPNSTIKEEKNVAVSNNAIIEQKHILYIDTNALKLAVNSADEKIQNKYVIEEGIDDEQYATNIKPKKNAFWNFASKALKKLNQTGIEKVNGSENNNELFIGPLSISKN